MQNVAEPAPMSTAYRWRLAIRWRLEELELAVAVEHMAWSSGKVSPCAHLVQPYSTITVLLGFTSSVGLNFNQRPNSLFSRRQLDESSAAGGAVSPTYNMACY